MSITYDLVCDELNIKIWIGQGDKLSSFYYGEPDTMKRLHEFLVITLGKPLKVMSEFESGDLGYISYGYDCFIEDFK